jgi:hypothetical protein
VYRIQEIQKEHKKIAPAPTKARVLLNEKHQRVFLPLILTESEGKSNESL